MATHYAVAPARALPRGYSGPEMQCDYFDAGACRSCAWMGTPYDRQLADKQATSARTLARQVPAAVWERPVTSAESAFRNKAKLVVGGAPGEVTLGILDGTRRGVDLRACGLYEPGLAAAIPTLADFVDELRLLPYDVPKARGELKHLLVTHSPGGELMVRFVLRGTRQLPRIADGIPELLRRLPQATVVSANLQPEHKAVLEGPEEIVLTDTTSLPMDLGGVRLHLRPNSFFQTNTAVTIELYHQAREWISDIAPRVVWDLYCGVGGFGLYAAAPGRVVRGVETSADAITSAQRSAAELTNAGDIDFVAGDAAISPWERRWPAADLVILNPPRRGIDTRLAADLVRERTAYVLYSSCNPSTLARDIDALAGYRVMRARLFDMFPQTAHSEVLVLLARDQDRAATAAS